MKIIVLNGSTRDNGNTEFLARLAVEGKEAKIVNLKDMQILPISDKRHDPQGFQPLHDDYETLIKTVLEYDAILFATPIYWYGMSGIMKNFIDRWSQSLRDKELNFKEKMKNKKAYVVACGGDEAKIKGLPLILQFKHIFEFMNMDFCGYVIGKGNSPGEVKNDHAACNEARVLLEANPAQH
ncbi:flavodoxin family protein [Bacillus methanolicus]|uniref:flavodoxin family protein n=1 Tax=Bacillus methanolicus TaxID=1471 RepID=UPI00200EC1ED|nr:NAD(P)H-dependent oxidoreductase [Bacillus methanolicus]UQD51264.1 flavodoxin family protein [Bacillus methanolicus]